MKRGSMLKAALRDLTVCRDKEALQFTRHDGGYFHPKGLLKGALQFY